MSVVEPRGYPRSFLRTAGARFGGMMTMDCTGRTGYGASATEAESLFASVSLPSGGPSTVLTL